MSSDMETLKLLMKMAPDLESKRLALDLQLKKDGSPGCDSLIAELIKEKLIDPATGFTLLKDFSEKQGKEEALAASPNGTLRKRDPMQGMKEAAYNAKVAIDSKLKELESVGSSKKKVLVSGCFDLLHSGCATPRTI